MLKSPTTKTLWQMSPKQKLHLQLSNISAQKIQELRDVQAKFNRDGRLVDIQFKSITIMPFWQRQELLISQSINRYLDGAYKNPEVTVSDIATEVHRLLGPRQVNAINIDYLTDEFPFYEKLRGVIDQYLPDTQVANVQLSGGLSYV